MEHEARFVAQCVSSFPRKNPKSTNHRQHDPFYQKNNRFRHFASPLDGLCVSGRHERVKCRKLYEKGTHVASDYVLGTYPTGLDRNGRASPWHRDMDTLLKFSKMKKCEKKGATAQKKKCFFCSFFLGKKHAQPPKHTPGVIALSGIVRRRPTAFATTLRALHCPPYFMPGTHTLGTL